MKAWIFPRFPGSTIRSRDGAKTQGAEGIKRHKSRKAGAAICILGLALGLFTTVPAYAQSSGANTGQAMPHVPEEGLWLSQDHDGVFEITRCGQTLCGRLIGMQYDGPVPKDVWGRSQCGLVMLTDFRLIKNENVWRGRILDPETGRTYDARIHVASPEVLKLRGFIMGIPLFGQTQTWTRYHGTIGPECKLP